VIQRVRTFLELIRFSHTLFALPFALASALLAWQKEPFHTRDLVGILLCMVFARSAAMAFNRLADRELDGLNPRTAQRHLPAGKISASAVALFAGICSAGFIASTAIFLWSDNAWPLRLSVPVLLFIVAYSFTKRFTALAHFWLGASLMLAPVAAWIAVRGLQDLTTPLLLGLAVLFWVAGFDIIYACQDLEFDRQAHLHSIPARLGVKQALRVAFVCHLVMVGLLLALYCLAPNLGLVFLVGVLGMAFLLLYEHWIVRPEDLSRVNQAFFVVNGLVSVGLLLVVALQLVLRI
jgi:4-hydroxybenzoate polyprenyltransferase